MSTQNQQNQQESGDDETTRRLNESYANISRRHQQPSVTIRSSFPPQQIQIQTNSAPPTPTTTTSTTSSTSTATPQSQANNNQPSTPTPTPTPTTTTTNSWVGNLGSFFSRENLSNVARNITQSLPSIPILSFASSSSSSTTGNSSDAEDLSGWVVMRDGRQISQEIYDEAMARALQSIYQNDTSGIEVSEDEIRDFVEQEARLIEGSRRRQPLPTNSDYLYPRNIAVNTNNANNINSTNNTFLFPSQQQQIPVQMPTMEVSDPFQAALLQLVSPSLSQRSQGASPIMIRFGSNSQNPDLLPLLQFLMRNEVMRSQLHRVDLSEGPDLSYEQLSSLENVNRGATNVNHLPTSIYHANERHPSSPNSCAICLSEYVEGDELKTLPCFHIYHKECIDEWLKNSKQCAICKIEVE